MAKKTHWTDLTIIDIRKQAPVTDLQERLRVLRLYRQVGYANGFVVKDGDKVARIDGTDWTCFNWG